MAPTGHAQVQAKLSILLWIELASDDHGLYVNLFVGCKARVSLGGQQVRLQQTTRYPWDGAVRIQLDPDKDAEFDLNLRVPGWCQKAADSNDLYQVLGRPENGAFTVKLNGEAVSPLPVEEGYAKLRRTWRAGDVVEIAMAMPARRVKAHPNVTADKGLVALMRGPLVYAVETTGSEFLAGDVFLPPEAPLTADFRSELLGGVGVLKAGFQARFKAEPQARAVNLEAIPYFCYGNRGKSDLRVWLPEQKPSARQ